ncbi:DUF5977 domain-containing protein [Mucilaginibacter sp. KACC 22773]|uniref:DUF5977 domain-containing protein n=1 Tax=Mucilaginibacter sp. KACC 22773 TaxID=3025671 RepID=UPI0023669E62|nr:DUF5977 domain-containing protein [Mucilaginibacter sp. KACC 22773]WDF75975.1 DUF5977 domain-containing protein [Mucilaginibacter sp. KACC 22773]
MFYRLLLVLFFTSFIVGALQAQSDYTRNFSTHSPNAFAFSKIDNIPMNNFTGMANINLPLYEKKMSILSFNMGLTYTGGGGLKKDNEPGIVGKGWLLHAGGVIIRHTRGIPDDYQAGPNSDNGTIPIRYNGVLYNGGVTYKPDGAQRITPSDPTFDYTNGTADSQHDIFEFNIPGKSGKFYIGKDKQIVVVTDSKIKIIPDFTNSTIPEFKLGSFLIIDEAGIKYYFNQVELTKEGTSGITPEGEYYNKEYPSSWLLTKVAAPFTEETITYQYIQRDIWHGASGNGIYVKRSDLPWGDLSGSGGPGAKEVDIQSITFSDQSKINFKYFLDGTSLTAFDPLLKSVEILNPQQEVIKTYALNYKHWSISENHPGRFEYSNARPEDGTRFNDYLNTVDIVGSNNSHQTIYAFDYFLDQNLNEFSVSNGYDYWGYYNGKTNATPYMVATQWGPAADRSPDLNYAKLGIIKRIVYPTGGSEEFEYELNNKRGTSGNVIVAGLRISKRTLHDGISSQNDIVKQYKYVETDGLSSGFLGETPLFTFVASTYYDDGGWPSNPHLANTTTYNFEQPANPLSSIDGSFAGYRRVEEWLQNGSSSNGKIVYEYSDLSYATPWDPNDYYPYRPVDRPNWAVGLPLKTTYFSSAGPMTRQVVNEYNVFQQQKIDDNYRSLYVSMDAKINFTPADVNAPFSGNIFTYRNYYPIVGRAELRATHEYNYTSTGAVTPNEVLTQNTYDANYFMLRTSSQLNSDGNTVKKYFYYPFDYNLGGSLSTLVTNNIINQPVLTESWLTRPEGSYLTQANVTEYQTLNSGVVRPLKIYTARLIRPLLTPISFSGAVLLPADHNFQPVLTCNTYDDKSRLVEFENPGGIKSAIILDKSGNTLAKADNASFSNIAYSGFETDDLGNWTYPLSGISSSSGKSGSKSYSGSITKSGLLSGNYNVSLWAKGSGSVTVNGISTAINSNWSLYKWALTGITGVTINTNGNLVDQVALSPQSAQMITANYYKGVGVESTTDANYKSSYFEYDEFTRLVNVKDQNSNIVKNYTYHYTTPFLSTSQSASFLKNDCPMGNYVSGPAVTYTVPAGKYTSLISQADADAQVVSDMYANGQSAYSYGQAYANTNGTCVVKYFNSALSVLFTRNNCTAGATPGQVYYVVPAQAYSSLISQADADNQAQNDVNANGQNYANANCVCADPITVTFSNSTSDSIGINFSTGINFSAGTGYNRSYVCPPGSSSLVLPAGTYNVSLSTINSSTTHNFYVGGRTAVVGSNANFTNVNISNGTGAERNVGIY